MQTSKVSFGNISVYKLERTGQNFLRNEYKNLHPNKVMEEAKADVFGTAINLEEFGIKMPGKKFIAATGGDETILKKAIDARKSNLSKAQELINGLIKKWEAYK